MIAAKPQAGAFSLVEVVLAIGIAAFALTVIFSLFSVSLQTNASVADQVEALSATKALPAFLQADTTTSSPTQTGFAAVYQLVQAPTPVTSPPPIYAYNIPVTSSSTATPPPPGTEGESIVYLSTNPLLTTTGGATAATSRQGRLFGVYLAVSPNFPIGTVANPTFTTLAAVNPSPSPSPGGYAEGALAVQVKVYVVPQVGVAPPARAFPVLTYDLILPH